MFAQNTLASHDRPTSTANMAWAGSGCSFSLQETREPEQHGTIVRGCDHNYSQVKRERFHGKVAALCHSKATVVRDQVHHPVCYRGRAGDNHVVFTCSIDRIGTMSNDGRMFAPFTLIKLPRNHTNRTYFAGAYDNLSALIDAELLAERVCERVKGASIRDIRDGMYCIRDPDTVDDFNSAIGEVFRRAMQHERALEPDGDLENAVRSLLDVLVSAVALSQDRHEELPRPTTRAYIVDKAVSFLEQHLWDPVSVPQLSAAVGVSTRTLRYSFEEIMGVSPSEYLLTVRLGMVRRELLAGSCMKTIYRIAHKYGFCNMSRFAHFYRQTFGELPSETSARSEQNKRRCS